LTVGHEAVENQQEDMLIARAAKEMEPDGRLLFKLERTRGRFAQTFAKGFIAQAGGVFDLKARRPLIQDLLKRLALRENEGGAQQCMPLNQTLQGASQRLRVKLCA
jgi:hypothetical protein